jgi:hypothetical protein
MRITQETSGVLSLRLDDDVALIAVEDIVELGEAELDPTYVRTIRFVSHAGREVLEVSVAAANEKAVELRHVKSLAPLRKKKIRVKNWLSGKVESQEVLDLDVDA